ncbi:bile acid:sodium symporter family protein [Aquibium sp. ELW1220]|uniref:bile acid:sodium symporter family protein n=1 Tax=Aquibium sp. ELW1220 TaxID=2976766 RepID=UPI0025AFC458|nr:bile acid:sodium symporter family protein [Aquibium sp. ELW1220]MDN2579505.1 bile acid:sodium symporter family protein [Aquibium sp. ELW1220]
MHPIITILMPAALSVMMFSLGLGLTIEDFRNVMRKPKAFAVGASAQFVLLPAIAFSIAQIFALSPEMAIGLMILSLCPGGPTSNLMTRFAHGDVALSISVNGVSSFAALFTMPLLVSFVVGHFLGADAPPIDLGSLGLSMFMLTTLPVAIGMAVRHYASRLADSLDGPMRRLASFLLIVFVVGTLTTNWSLFVESLPTLGPSVILLGCSLILLGLGLSRLASLSPAQATAISIDTGIQNAALGIAVGALIAGPGVVEPAFSVPSGVYGVIMYLLVIPFTLWRRRLAGRTYSAAASVPA